MCRRLDIDARRQRQVQHDRADIVLGVEEEDAARDVVVAGAVGKAVEAVLHPAFHHFLLCLSPLPFEHKIRNPDS